MTSTEIDLTYAISEIQDIQAEMELHDLSSMGARLEGVEARLKEVTEALIEFAFDPGNPHAAGLRLFGRLTAPQE